MICENHSINLPRNDNIVDDGERADRGAKRLSRVQSWGKRFDKPSSWQRWHELGYNVTRVSVGSPKGVTSLIVLYLRIVSAKTSCVKKQPGLHNSRPNAGYLVRWCKVFRLTVAPQALCSEIRPPNSPPSSSRAIPKRFSYGPSLQSQQRL